jgi:hypothetical protein
MSARRASAGLSGLVALAALCFHGGAATAHAAGQAWTGNYSMVTYASQKAGTSAAARLPESDFGAVFTLATSCSGRVCTATANGPASSNPTVPNPLTYRWDGQQWKSVYDWVWQCSVGGSGQLQWSPAQSFTFYTPQSDGSLRGIWHTDIATGACRGSVTIPVAAVPA